MISQALTKNGNQIMTDHDIYMSQKRFGSLDGLRAISILLVIWIHTAPSWIPKNFVTIGDHGVTLFFAISGFLITTLLIREFARNGKIDLKAFYLRRSLRIFPLYYGVLLIYILLVTFLEKDSEAKQEFFGNLIYFVTYTSNIFVQANDRVIFLFAWSLAAEEQFYLVWPPTLYILGKLHRANIFLGLLAIVCIASSIFDGNFHTVIPLAIVSGALLATTLNDRSGFNALQSILGRRLSPVVFAIAYAIAISAPTVPLFVIHILAAALVGACIIREGHVLALFLKLQPLAYIGTISYGIYMLHMLCKSVIVKILTGLRFSGTGIELFVLTLFAAIVIASLSFKYYESFFLKLKSRFER
jgi:peptidoglycan/LPS O-acetylase OafA/YrhL